MSLRRSCTSLSTLALCACSSLSEADAPSERDAPVAAAPASSSKAAIVGQDPGGAQAPAEAGQRPRARTQVARIAAGRSCPSPSAPWVLDESLRDRDQSPSDRSGGLMARLGRYCVYRSPAGATEDLRLTDPEAVVQSVAADYDELLPQAPIAGPTESVVPVASDDGGPPTTRAEFFVEQQGAAFSDDAATLLADHAADRPFVAVVDTADRGAPRSLGGAPRLQHGLAMAGIIDTLRCPASDTSCRERTFFEQAFPYTHWGAPGREDYEAKGSVWSLTEAVVAAVEHWNDLRAEEGAKLRAPLVLNMSVGFEWTPEQTNALLHAGKELLAEELPKDLDTGLTPAQEALYLALSWASCRGALPVAAAGNTRAGACDGTEPMAPGAWEAIPAPTPAQCQAAFGIEGAPESGGSLVYAAGGIDEGNRSIVNARANAVAARVLYSSLTPSDVGGDQTAPWTGTSVATASLSAIAAQVWTLQPALDAHGVMKEIDGTAAVIDPDWKASIHGSSLAAPEVRRVRACDLPVLAPLYPTRTARGAFPRTGRQQALPLPTNTTRTLDSATTQVATCSGRTVTTYPAPDLAALPTHAWPELRPQPEMSICPSCPLTITDGATPDGGTPGARITIAIDSNYQVDVGTAKLELHTVPPGQTRQVTELPIDVSACMDPSTGTLRHTPCSVDLSGYTLQGTTTQSLPRFMLDTTVHQVWVKFEVHDSQGTSAYQLVGNDIPVFYQ